MLGPHPAAALLDHEHVLLVDWLVVVLHQSSSPVVTTMMYHYD
jgi:hypothetical protein